MASADHHVIDIAPIAKKMLRKRKEFDTLLPYLERELARQLTIDLNKITYWRILTKVNPPASQYDVAVSTEPPLTFAQFNCDNREYFPTRIIYIYSGL